MENKNEEYFEELICKADMATAHLKDVMDCVQITELWITSLVDLSDSDYGLEARTVIRSMKESAEYLKEILGKEKESILEDSK